MRVCDRCGFEEDFLELEQGSSGESLCENCMEVEEV